MLLGSPYQQFLTNTIGNTQGSKMKRTLYQNISTKVKGTSPTLLKKQMTQAT